MKLRDQQIEQLSKDQEENQTHQEKQAELIKELQQSLAARDEQHSKLLDALKTEHENLTNEFQQTKQAKENMQSLLDQPGEKRLLRHTNYLMSK